MKNQQESGVVLMAVVIILLPVIVTVGAYVATMTSRTDRLADEVIQERALLAAESGVDLAIWIGQNGGLSHNVSIPFNLGRDTDTRILPVHLQADGVDNDGDTLTDEDDEDVFQVTVAGTYLGTTRNIAAYLGPVPPIPFTIPAAVTLLNPNVGVDLRGTPYLIGHDYNMDGSRGDPANDVSGLAIGDPGTLADLASELNGSEDDHIIGAGGTPSLGLSPSLDIASLVTLVENSADMVLTNRRYASFDFGNGPAGTPLVSYRDGDVKFTSCQGAGILVITGNLEIGGNFRFDGLVVVLGDIELGSGTAQIFGALIQGPTGSILSNRGTMDVRYSSEAIALANSIRGRYVAFNGWQELAR